MAIVNQVSVKETISGTPTEVVYDLAPGNYYGTCTSQAANQNKAVSVSSDQIFSLKKGILLAVKFDANNTYNATTDNPVKLNVNNTGAKQIYGGASATPTGTNTTYFGRTNYVNYYIYDGTYWVWAGSSSDNNTTYTPQALGFGYGTCSTAASTTAKTATLTGYNLITNGIVAVKFTNAVPADATLNVNSKGAKNIWYKGANVIAGIIKAGDIATFIYDGTRYQLISIDSGNGLPDEVITYEQFLQKSDSEQATYTGYITGWPGSGGGGLPTETITYAEFSLMSDAEQLAFTGYVTDYPGIDDEPVADDVIYDNTDSGLTANNVQDAIDEVNDKVNRLNKNDLGSDVDISGYTSSNMYTFDSDGYINIDTVAGQNNIVITCLLGSTSSEVLRTRTVYNRDIVYVRQGMRFYVSTNSGTGNIIIFNRLV